MARWLPAWIVVLSLSALPASAEVLVITKDTVLDPAMTYDGIVIKASNITINGRGAWVIGSKEGKPNVFKGVGVYAKGVSNVTIVELNVKGFETGLHIEEGSGWTIEDCDFSDNFHAPEFGWGENGRRGGIVLQRVTNSRLSRNRANRVWDGCVLVDSHDNRLIGNDFSRCSNTCLKLWTACRNVVEENNLSYGIRKDPGEVHARDSAGVLIESGSNGNRFIRNNCRYGGDGIFIRVLNGWVSTDNYFEENDCSYANNNCVEAWSPRNTYVRNKANYGSYGFWLGASDQTVLIDNEASYNGLAEWNHNSPHLPKTGHAGIVFMFGPSSHTVCRGNRCIGNNGAGIAAIGDLEKSGKFKAHHWVIEQNVLRDNRWGVYLKNADWVRVAGNEFGGNHEADLQNDGGVTRLTKFTGPVGETQPPKAILEGPASTKVGAPVHLDAFNSSDPSGKKLAFAWDLGDGETQTAPSITKTFSRPGFYRIGVTVDNGVLSDLAWRDFYVVDDAPEAGTEGEAALWSWRDAGSKAIFANDLKNRIAGDQSLSATIDPYSGGRVNLLYPTTQNAALPLQGKSKIQFWWKAINPNLPGWQDVNPVITLYQDEENYVRLTPTKDFLSSPPYIEAREGWTHIVAPLAGDAEWTRETRGEVQTVNYFTIGVDSWGGDALRIWLDGLAIQ